MFQRIVVPLDGSELAERALPEASDLGRITSAPIHVVRVVDLGRLEGNGSLTFGVFPWSVQHALDDEERSARAYVERVCLTLGRHGMVASCEVRLGDAAREIIAATGTGDVVVMATHGRGGVSRWYLGSVAEAVARHASGPVMLIRATAVETGSDEPGTTA